MKFDIRINQREGFDISYSIIFDNGLVLTTEGSLIFMGRDERIKTKEKFKEVIDLLSKTCPLIKD